MVVNQWLMFDICIAVRVQNSHLTSQLPVLGLCEHTECPGYRVLYLQPGRGSIFQYACVYVLMYVYVCLSLSSISLSVKHQSLQEFESYLPRLSQALDTTQPSSGLTLSSLPVSHYKPGNKCSNYLTKSSYK